MDGYRHHVSGFFAHREEAQSALSRLIGTAAGAQTGVEHKDGWLSDLIRDAIASGQIVLVAQTLTKQETAIVR